MACQNEQGLKPPLPACTLSILFLSASAFIFPAVSRAFVYDRAAILSGEVWRLLTGHLIHFNLSHLLYNLAAFGFVGWFLEPRLPRVFWTLSVTMVLSISVFLLVSKTELMLFGGLSGLACGLLVCIALYGIQDSGLWGKLCWAVLFAVSVKVFFENYLGESVLPYPKGPPLMVVWEAHALGGLISLAAFTLQKAFALLFGMKVRGTDIFKPYWRGKRDARTQAADNCFIDDRTVAPCRVRQADKRKL